MCWDCVNEFFATEGVEWDDDYLLPLPDPTPEHLLLMSDIWHFYQLPGCGVGGPLHIVTDDGNVEDHNLDYCRKELEVGDHWSFQECETEEERQEIKDLGNKILDAIYAMSSYAERHQVLRMLSNPYSRTPPTLP